MLARRNRFDYLKDFVADENGKYVYTGSTYTLNLDDTGKNRFQTLGIPAGLSVLSLAFAILSGVIPATYMNGHAVVVLSYAASLIGSALTAICAIRMFFAKDPVREYNYRETVDKLVPNAWISVIGFGISVPAYLYFMIRYGTGMQAWASILFVLFQFFGGISSYLITRFGKQICYRVHPGINHDEEKNESPLPDPDEYRVV